MRTIKKTILKNILLLVAILGFGLVIYSARHQLEETWTLISGVSLGSLLMLPLTQLISYFFLSEYYRSMIFNFGGRIRLMRTYGTTIALNFVNQILPSGGASGITYIIYAYRDAVDGGKITLIQLGRYVFAFLSYVPLLVAAWLWLAASGDFNGNVQTLFYVLLVICLPGMLLLVLAVSNQKFVEKFLGGVLGFINRLLSLFTRGKAKPITVSASSGFIKEFGDGVKFLKSQGQKIIVPYLFMLMSTMAEITIVTLAFAIIGVDINPGIIILAFTAANAVGVVSIIPGDVGVHELTMITVLGYVGVEQSAAIAGTLLYRVFNKLIIMAIGFISYIYFLKPLVNNAKVKPSPNG